MTVTLQAKTGTGARPETYRPAHQVRIVTAASLFDGHDAAINIMRRILQASGAEVIHLGHDRAARDIVDAAVQEDVQGIAVSSYQGGHMEFFRYMVDLLAQHDCRHIKVFGGGGGTIIPEEKRELEAHGVTRIYHPDDGRRMGLQGMIDDMLAKCDFSTLEHTVPAEGPSPLTPTAWKALARAISLAEAAAHGIPGGDVAAVRRQLDEIIGGAGQSRTVPVVGITGTGGAGKSSFTDEMVRRFVEDFPAAHVAILSVDPTKSRTGGALLGDRIRMNSLARGRVYMRSMATRGPGLSVSHALADAIAVCRAAAFDLIVVETSGIGQADSSIVPLADLSLYVMTPEFGAQTQLEKIEMIDLADMVVINKYDKAGGDDALRDVRKAYQRAHARFDIPPDDMPVYATVASQFNDRGCNAVYDALLERLRPHGTVPEDGRFAASRPIGLPDRAALLPARRSGYLGDVAHTVRAYKARARERAGVAAELWALRVAVRHLTGAHATDAGEPQPYAAEEIAAAPGDARPLMEAFNALLEQLDPDSLRLLAEWPELCRRYRSDTNRYEVRGHTLEVENTSLSLARQAVPKVALPTFTDWPAVLHWRLLENVPGAFPFTAGVFPYKRRGEDPTRMFAGEGGPWRTNRRFHYLSRHSEAKRLSTAFDSPTLYGQDPDRRPDIWGKVGNSGVSIATVEDIEALYAGFDLTDPRTSVSMTINGPAPTMLAFYFNAAVRQALRKHLRARGLAELTEAECLQPNGGGYAFEQLRAMVDDATYTELLQDTVCRVRGTVQADILKEDQAQNTCIFSTDFALKMMGDVQSWFVEHDVRNFYSVSISGYHIAEAGANPITQLAFTLANGFTYVEYYLARGMDINAFAPNLSFFFSNGMDPEYAVIGRVARRIWATALRDLYGADERGQKLKYHIQTSGRSLHAQDIEFNDIRTTLQGLLAVCDNCNSLHTNAYDEAITTPTEESVRRALAIQLIINREFGLTQNENPQQGAFLIDHLTELVEEAVLDEFERLDERGGVLGAMERMYQRSKIQEESLHYEQLKHSGELPLMGVNTFLSDAPPAEETTTELIRASEEEKEDQLRRLLDFQARHEAAAPAALARLKETALTGGNVFGALMEAVQALSLGQISRALYEVGGQYRRSM